MAAENKGGKAGAANQGKNAPDPKDQKRGGMGEMTAPEEQSKDYSTIRKGIYLSALIYIEGNQAPAANFSAVAKSALKARLMSDSGQDGLTVSLRKIEEQTNMEEKDTAGGQAPQAGGEKSDKSGKAHFEF